MSKNYLTITALTKYLKRKFEADPHLDRVYLTGEISNFRPRPNAHQYFSLKDDQAKISAIMFKGAFQKLKFQPKEGMKVLVVGRVSLYEASGNYQIYIEHMEPDGVGALYQALEELKGKLSKEGLFTAPKKELSRYPQRIAVVTSPSGAVIRDIMTTLQRRYPIAELVLFPTLVQGDKAAADICRNLTRIEACQNFDTVIVARGGGSIEDLWPFNEEIVARAIAGLTIPVISSVGHETDVTIADLVADVRAATPTAAAELAVPVLSDELLKIKEKENRLIKSYSYLLEQQQARLKHTMSSFVFTQPERLYEGFTIKLDLLTRRFQQSSHQAVLLKKDDYMRLLAQLNLSHPGHRLAAEQQRLKNIEQQFKQVSQQLLKNKQQHFGQLVQSLDILSPLKTMGRGYTYVTQAETLVAKAEDLKNKDEMTIHFNDGQVDVTVQEIRLSEGEK
ncbi:exodeoxyribonuclease VII large subunit [Vagococcus intermedius]|uniref:Exodeoxyribonuclease 7 large subunit n=1 Tax=Vagococcus intermedius TaxID=2991418 RepID=A0AAF0I857_9ENTE|nr:exodeoxyribonuclease VII large subunit [Vagococcus intermedius]WEG73844.1 exodeoxyribonuclease VII large subunit [Vagococcus intermedius]WEG75929.1 exodeoxyribonuclease VII large subunit [Vagococcus intermedius]